MTVIAYRDGILATDSYSTDEGTIYGTVRKIARDLDGSLAAGTGSSAVIEEFLGNFRRNSGNLFKLDYERDEFSGVIIKPNGSVYDVDYKGRCVLINAPFHAYGAGRFLAMGAMAHGATAEQSVAIAIQFEGSCGGPIQVERLNP